jgi:bifunctional polynucleotide phosphatase/kinase
VQTTQIGTCRRASTILTSPSGSKYRLGIILRPTQRPHLLTGRRCFVFQGSIELAWHNNLYRAYARPASVVAREVRRSSSGHSMSLIQVLQSTRELIPYAALIGFAGAHEAPSVKEGFVEVRDIPWRFEGNEEERRHWSMWLQIDGK